MYMYVCIITLRLLEAGVVAYINNKRNNVSRAGNCASDCAPDPRQLFFVDRTNRRWWLEEVNKISSGAWRRENALS